MKQKNPLIPLTQARKRVIIRERQNARRGLHIENQFNISPGTETAFAILAENHPEALINLILVCFLFAASLIFALAMKKYKVKDQKELIHEHQQAMEEQKNDYETKLREQKNIYDIKLEDKDKLIEQLIHRLPERHPHAQTPPLEQRNEESP